MKYALLIYGNEKSWEEDNRDEVMAAHERYTRMLADRNLGGEELARSTTATTIRHKSDGLTVTDGPYAETAEQLGGFYLIEAADLDEAIALAKQLPEPIVEVRPVVSYPA